MLVTEPVKLIVDLSRFSTIKRAVDNINSLLTLDEDGLQYGFTDILKESMRLVCTPLEGCFNDEYSIVEIEDIIKRCLGGVPLWDDTDLHTLASELYSICVEYKDLYGPFLITSHTDTHLANIVLLE